ncbi:DUF4244 domain-containing protein [Streptomyces sp. NPDC055103]
MTGSVAGSVRGLAKGSAKCLSKGPVTGPVKGFLRGWWLARRRATRADAGMTTSEYAVGTIAAAAFAAVLYKIVTSGTVSGALESMIGRALNAPF